MPFSHFSVTFQTPPPPSLWNPIPSICCKASIPNVLTIHDKHKKSLMFTATCIHTVSTVRVKFAPNLAMGKRKCPEQLRHIKIGSMPLHIGPHQFQSLLYYLLWRRGAFCIHHELSYASSGFPWTRSSDTGQSLDRQYTCTVFQSLYSTLVPSSNHFGCIMNV